MCRKVSEYISDMKSSNSTPKMLIVDDSRVSRMMIKARIEHARPDWTILEAGNADEAMNQVAQHSPDFVSMDVNMPGLSGFETIEKLRAAGCQARIVMLTANFQQSSRDRAAELLVNFVQKPVTEASIEQMLSHFAAAT